MISGNATPICLLQVLNKYSDEKHILPMRDIIAKMKSEYDISLDRRTVYAAVSLLITLGIEICTYEENGTGYYLKQRVFEPGEVRLLMDAIYSFPFLPPKHTEDLVLKLQELQSTHERKRLKHLTLVRSEVKTSNRQVLWIIEQLDEAISKGVKVEFTYLCYDIHKELVPRRRERYTVNPYGTVFNNCNYYLVCVKDNKEKVSMYRIDKMKDIEITDSPLDPREEDFDPRELTERAIYAYSGEPELITLKCKRSVLDHIIDKFGTEINIIQKGEDELEICFKASPGGVKYWAMQYMPHLEVVSPQWLRDEIIDCIRENPYLKT